MKKLKNILIGSATLLLMACGGSKEPDKTLTFYAGLQDDHAAMIAKEFQAKTGIKTDYVRMSSGEVLARLKAEKNNMTASVWYGGPADAFVAAQAEGLLEPYKSKEDQYIPANLKDPGNYWTGIYVGYLGFVGNQKMLAEKGLEMPKSWNDLLDPKFKGEIVVAHPGSSGTAYTMVATLVQLMGEDKAMEYLKQLNQNVRQYTKSGTAPGRMAGQGEVTVGITFLHDAIKYKKEGFSDIIISAPEEGTGFEIGGVALLKNAPNPEAGKMFIDWVLSKEVQELGKTVGSYQFLTNSNANPPEEAMQLKGTKLINYDFDWAGNNRVRLVEKFTTETETDIPQK
ncbi:ABC transporter substrate-binding protein [uncultured Cetobacterium sp.]|uniref:ABC transporter substrate-binding protein n=1 Tax=uncultured Cetobacterium sp. TaxID=527638 RepID=UPI00260935D5|nr:ABC transporter substrate-binding protein [uncultured Cetobacterium sp.]